VSPTVAVLGAVNVDLVVRVPKLPGPGVTITGGTFSRHHGGKGGNQAVAAARALGGAGRIVMLGCVGEDDLGREATRVLEAEGIDVAGIAHAPDTPTGIALITVDEAGENQIAVAPGANLRLEPSSARAALDRTEPTLVLVSLEASPEATTGAADWCRTHDVPMLLNPAPVQQWARGLLRAATYLTPNQHELETLGALPEGLVVVETLGAEGAAIRSPGVPERRVRAPTVEPVDTTGAGDCLNGVLAASLAEGMDLLAAVRRAVVAAALSTTVQGAREGMPTRGRIDTALC
jgi:ribokinase